MSWDPTRPSNTRAARTMRARVLREEPICRVPDCYKPSVEDDHIVPWSQREARGMTVSEWHARSNHQGLCVEHHAKKTQAEALAARIAKSPKRRARRHPSDPAPTPRRPGAGALSA